MNEPTLEEINSARKQGLRPGVVVCIVNGEKKLLMFHKSEYSEWQIPQGSIANKETPHEAIYREMMEELGEAVVKTFKDPVTYLGTESLEFPPQRHGVKELQTDEGEEILMKGKKYYFYVIYSDIENINAQETEFDACFWVTAKEARYLADASKAVNKKQLILNIISQLIEKNFLE